MVTLLERARGLDLRAVAAFGYEDGFLVWSGATVVMTTPTECSCDRVSCRGGCPHMGFVRELIARAIDARDPVSIGDLKRSRPQAKLPADGRTSSPYLGVTWCELTGRWRASIMIAGKHHRIGRFDREEDAARAYDWATFHRPDLATRRMGRRPRFNFPTDLPPAQPAGITDHTAILTVLDAA